MGHEKMNARLIELIHERTPSEQNPATLLSDTLGIGREAAYRRLRGEVLFTFDEAAQVADKLHLSLDHTTREQITGNAMFRISFTDYLAAANSYETVIKNDITILHDICRKAGSELSEAGNQIPQSLYLKYENLANFKLFKWLYQHGKVLSPAHTFEDLFKTPRFSDCYRNFMTAVQQVDTTYYIFDNTICQHWVQAIRYFSALHLISAQDIAILRSEILALLDDLEEMAITGCNSNGKRVSIYVSELDIEANYMFIKSGAQTLTSITVYSLNSLRTENPSMVEHMDKWIQSLRKFSTLITQSSDLMRTRFFSQQREIVESALKQ